MKNTEGSIARSNGNANEYGPPAAVCGREIARAFNPERKFDFGLLHVRGLTACDEA